MSGKVYTKVDLIKIQKDAEGRRIIEKRKEQIKEKLKVLEQRVIKAIEEGSKSVFLTEKVLQIPSLTEDVYFSRPHNEYIKELKKIFPDSEITIQENCLKHGAGIFIDFLVD